jgi:hypothetical protein
MDKMSWKSVKFFGLHENFIWTLYVVTKFGYRTSGWFGPSVPYVFVVVNEWIWLQNFIFIIFMNSPGLSNHLQCIWATIWWLKEYCMKINCLLQELKLSWWSQINTYFLVLCTFTDQKNPPSKSFNLLLKRF